MAKILPMNRSNIGWCISSIRSSYIVRHQIDARINILLRFCPIGRCRVVRRSAKLYQWEILMFNRLGRLIINRVNRLVVLARK